MTAPRMTAPHRKMATPALRQNKKDKYWVASSRTVRHAWLPPADGEGKFHRAGPDAGMPTLGLEWPGFLVKLLGLRENSGPTLWILGGGAGSTFDAVVHFVQVLVGFGRIIASWIEAPILFANLE